MVYFRNIGLVFRVLPWSVKVLKHQRGFLGTNIIPRDGDRFDVVGRRSYLSK